MPKNGKNCVTTDEWKMWFSGFLASIKAEKDFILYNPNPQIVKIVVYQVGDKPYGWRVWGLAPDQVLEFYSVAKKNELAYLESSKYVRELLPLEYGETVDGGQEYWTPVISDRSEGLLEDLRLTPFVRQLKETSPFIEIVMMELSGEANNEGSFSIESSKPLQLPSPNLQILEKEFGCEVYLEGKKLTVCFKNLERDYREVIAFKAGVILMS